MLTRLSLRDYLFVKRLDIAFGGGFNVLSGETGAGKSLLIGALAILAGGRSVAVSRGGGTASAAVSAEIEAAFSLAGNAAAQQWLRDKNLQDSDDEETLLVRRVLGGGGRKSVSYLNGRQTPLALAAEIVSSLMDICGQHAHHSLRDATSHRELLDAAGDIDITAAAAAHRQWRAAKTKWEKAATAAAQNDKTRAVLVESLRELESVGFSEEKWQRLNAQLGRTANIAGLAESGGETLALLGDEDGGAQTLLGKARQNLTAMQRNDASLSNILAELTAAGELLHNIAGSLSSYMETLETDPQQLREAESFVAECHRLARKRGLADAALLGAEIALLRAQLDALPDAAGLDALRQAAADARQSLDGACVALSAARKKTAASFTAQVNADLHRLGMARARLSAELTPLAEPSSAGAEKVAFQIVTRAGMPPGPIADVASGGELSRLGLAVHLACGRGRGRTVALFDEVDAGVGGATAGIVGELLRALGRKQQVLCVTHLPQVAAGADAHWQVGGDAPTVRRLSAAERVEELARMHSSGKITNAARQHAAEMLQAARPPKAE